MAALCGCGETRRNFRFRHKQTRVEINGAVGRGTCRQRLAKMSDSDSEEAAEAEAVAEPFSLAAFHSGNSDEHGQLEGEELFDEKTKKCLADLATLVPGSYITEATASEYDASVVDGAQLDEEGWVKSNDNAVDCSDITELTEDDVHSGQAVCSLQLVERAGNEDSDNVILLPTIASSYPTLNKSDFSNSSHSESEQESREDKPTFPQDATKQLPSATDLFPEFRPGKRLRFLRLFGPGKNAQSVWSTARGKLKKKQQKLTQEVQFQKGEAATEEGTEGKLSWEYKFAPTPPPEQCLPDDEDIGSPANNS
ncbi:transcription initiation factor TFIID subunit 1-like [Lacerta agilis]|uniref:transcription initiation factor TFIID subunit 1-like n=1 Tax=Lacerta agilis TaxID=80427 RepID=UPI0014191DCA|nr:transcription initiation factor TFIID subunit 1-like [Lacerta agilis]